MWQSRIREQSEPNDAVGDHSSYLYFRGPGDEHAQMGNVTDKEAVE